MAIEADGARCGDSVLVVDINGSSVATFYYIEGQYLTVTTNSAGWPLHNGELFSGWQGVVGRVLGLVRGDGLPYKLESAGRSTYSDIRITPQMRASDLARVFRVDPEEMRNELHDYLIVPPGQETAS